MKKSDIFVSFVLALVISFSFLSIQTNKAIGQTTSSSSSSSGVTSTSSGSACTPEQITTCLISSPVCASGESPVAIEGRCCASCVKSSGVPQTSTSSSGFNCIPRFSNCSCSTVCGPDTPGFVIGACLNPSCTKQLDPTVTCGKVNGECVVTSSGASSSSTSSSSGTLATINLNFTGVWKGETAKPKSAPSTSSGNLAAHMAPPPPRGSKIITFKLCVNDGTLTGNVDQGGALSMGIITLQTIVSPDEVIVSVEDVKGNKSTINLKLTSERELTGTFIDGGQTFTARKLNSFRACNAPGHSGEGMSEPPAMGGMDSGPSLSSSGSSDMPPPMGAMGGMDFGPSSSSGEIHPPVMGGMDSGPSMGDMPPAMGGMDSGPSSSSGEIHPPVMGSMPPVMGAMGDSSGGSSSGSSDEEDGPLEGPDESNDSGTP